MTVSFSESGDPLVFPPAIVYIKGEGRCRYGHAWKVLARDPVNGLPVPKGTERCWFATRSGKPCGARGVFRYVIDGKEIFHDGEDLMGKPLWWDRQS